MTIPDDDVEAGERVAIQAEPELPPLGTPARTELDREHAAAVRGLRACFAQRQSPPRGVHLTISRFDTAVSKGPAIGTMVHTTWGALVTVLSHRREGGKDGGNFIPATFRPEPDGRVRRLKRTLVARTAVVLDVEAHKTTGEIPPSATNAALRLRQSGWAAVIYTSHSHRPDAPRYRIVAPLSEEVAHDLPAPEVIAGVLGLGGVIDLSKVGGASLFFLPSAAPGEMDRHQTMVIDGTPIDATWMREAAGAVMAERQAEADRKADAAHAEAAARRAAKTAAGFDLDDSLIERLRSRFDLGEELLRHRYEKAGTKFRHPNSSSGSFGADIKTFGGIERVFSHNGGDPLHADNLPAWCGGATAVDVIDAVTILDFAGDRRKALAELAQRFGLTKAEERKAVARLIFKMIRRQATQEDIEQAALSEGGRLGLARDEICHVAAWVAATAAAREAA